MTGYRPGRPTRIRSQLPLEYPNRKLAQRYGSGRQHALVQSTIFDETNKFPQVRLAANKGSACRQSGTGLRCSAPLGYSLVVTQRWSRRGSRPVAALSCCTARSKSVGSDRVDQSQCSHRPDPRSEGRGDLALSKILRETGIARSSAPRRRRRNEAWAGPGHVYPTHGCDSVSLQAGRRKRAAGEAALCRWR